MENRIKKEISKSEITVNRVYTSEYQKEGTLTAELKQTVLTKSYYPTKSVKNSINGNIFSSEDFGFEETEYKSNETRVAWIDVPLNSTVESVKAKLQTVKGANLYRILSNKPIIADTEKYAIENPQLNVTIDTFSERQVVRYPDNSEKAGELALDKNGKIQYRRIAFSVNSAEDQDLRTKEPSDFYASPALVAELNNVEHIMEGQSL